MKATLPLIALIAAFSLSGCGQYWNEEAGASLDQGEFGNATMNNQLAMTCRKVTASTVQKYGTPLASNCPGRVQDGEYALFAYQQTITSAAEAPPGTISGGASVGGGGGG